LELRFIKKEKYNYLIANIDENLKNGNYIGNETWIKDELLDDFTLPTGIELQPVQLILDENDPSASDFENCKLLYNTMKDLPMDIITNPQFWAYLTHVTYWDYMHKRSDIHQNTTIKSIKEKFFDSGNFSRNGIARLWWLSHLTYDKNHKDPFHLTEILLKSQDFITHLIGRKYSNNSNFTKFILLSIDEYSIENEFPDRYQLRFLCEEINRLGSFKILDYLPYEEVKELVFSSLNQYLINKERELSNA
jgi:hypothetical protein